MQAARISIIATTVLLLQLLLIWTTKTILANDAAAFSQSTLDLIVSIDRTIKVCAPLIIPAIVYTVVPFRKRNLIGSSTRLSWLSTRNYNRRAVAAAVLICTIMGLSPPDSPRAPATGNPGAPAYAAGTPTENFVTPLPENLTRAATTPGYSNDMMTLPENPVTNSHNTDYNDMFSPLPYVPQPAETLSDDPYSPITNNEIANLALTYMATAADDDATSGSPGDLADGADDEIDEAAMARQADDILNFFEDEDMEQDEFIATSAGSTSYHLPYRATVAKALASSLSDITKFSNLKSLVHYRKFIKDIAIIINNFTDGERTWNVKDIFVDEIEGLNR